MRPVSEQNSNRMEQGRAAWTEQDGAEEERRLQEMTWASKGDASKGDGGDASSAVENLGEGRPPDSRIKWTKSAVFSYF